MILNIVYLGAHLSHQEIPRPREYFIAMRDILHDDDKENTTGEDLATIILRDTIRRLKARPFDEVTTQNILTSLQEYFKNVYSRRCDPDMIPCEWLFLFAKSDSLTYLFRSDLLMLSRHCPQKQGLGEP